MSHQVATFANGCFWCTEAIFKSLMGVEKVTPGYTGGHVPKPTYEQVCTGTTGHAEALQVEFDPTVISYQQLCEVFFATHNPTTLNQQGNDVGEQYRSAIFYHDEDQRRVAETVMGEVGNEKIFDAPIVTQLVPFKDFFEAEDYHRDYYAKNPNQSYCQMVIAPKVAKFRQKFAPLIKDA